MNKNKNSTRFLGDINILAKHNLVLYKIAECSVLFWHWQPYHDFIMLFDKIILVACKLLTFTTFKKKSYRKEIG
jgi:hypothetical protein